jgi:hypothetical protein
MCVCVCGKPVILMMCGNVFKVTISNDMRGLIMAMCVCERRCDIIVCIIVMYVY